MMGTHYWKRILKVKRLKKKWEVRVCEEEASQLIQLTFRSKIYYPTKGLAIKAGIDFIRRRQAFNALNSFMYD